MLDEHITWNEHIKTIGKKLAENIGLLYKATVLLDKESLKTIYLSYIHSYLNILPSHGQVHILLN